MKTILPEMKNTLNGNHGRLGITEEKLVSLITK